VIASNFTLLAAHPGFNDVEIWELKNDSGGWFHPVHIHLIDFKILDRNGRPPFDYEKAPKDTVYVGEDETVRAIMRFEKQVGRYMFHCHNLVHEDHDMVRPRRCPAGAGVSSRRRDGAAFRDHPRGQGGCPSSRRGPSSSAGSRTGSSSIPSIPPGPCGSFPAFPSLGVIVSHLPVSCR
jgi:spore coat protein A, manganese oxidase